MRPIILFISIFSVLFFTDAVNVGEVRISYIDTVPKPNIDTLPIDSIVPQQLDTLLLGVPDSLSLTDSFQVSGKLLKGIASFYHARFEGRRTATGEIFRHEAFTAASNHFKLNTLVRVTNLKNNKSIIVRINDRMHKNMKKKGRVVDLTRNGASALGFLKNGLTRVSVEPVVVVFAKKSMGISSE